MMYTLALYKQCINILSFKCTQKKNIYYVFEHEEEYEDKVQQTRFPIQILTTGTDDDDDDGADEIHAKIEGILQMK